MKNINDNLESIDRKLDEIIYLFNNLISKDKCNDCKKEKEEDEVLNFLENLAEELDIADRVRISKIEIK